MSGRWLMSAVGTDGVVGGGVGGGGVAPPWRLAGTSSARSHSP